MSAPLHRQRCSVVVKQLVPINATPSESTLQTPPLFFGQTHNPQIIMRRIANATSATHEKPHTLKPSTFSILSAVSLELDTGGLSCRSL